MVNIYHGPVVNPKTLTDYDALPRCLIAIGLDGNILWIEDDVEVSAVQKTIALRGLQNDEYDLIDFSSKPGEFIMPGLIDTHVHACQFPILGFGGDNQLLDWLLETVFPAEAKFENEDYARVAYNSVVDRSIASGTTTSCYYGSLHLSSTMILADIVKDKGQRAFVGKCNMDWNCPGYYIEKTPEASLQDTIKLIKYIQTFPPSKAKEPLVHPIIAPRFALSCTDKLLARLGKLAATLPKVSIQTHISENRREVEDTMRRFGAESYADVYDRFGLLRNNTILGHGVWLTEKEMKLIAERGAGVAHCPTSNFYLSSGIAKVGLLLDHGIKVGLGTDVGGGYNPSMLHTIQMASTASKMIVVQAKLDEERRQQRRAHRHCKHWESDNSDEDSDEDSTSSDEDSESESDSDSDSDSEEEVHEAHRSKHQSHNGDREHHNHHHHHHHGHDEQHNGRGEHHRDGPSQGQTSFANKKLETATLLYLATLGGANVCCLQNRIGSFEVGKAFDALHVSLDNACGNLAVWGASLDEVPYENEEDDTKTQESAKVRRWLERFLFTGDNRNVRKVWVQGTLVGGAEKHTYAPEV